MFNAENLEPIDLVDVAEIIEEPLIEEVTYESDPSDLSDDY